LISAFVLPLVLLLSSNTFAQDPKAALQERMAQMKESQAQNNTRVRSLITFEVTPMPPQRGAAPTPAPQR
jgi:protein-disulfide isomerase